ncbi:hypothetical protein CAC42_257 [Sphaceloma murrayae]|uniref:DUF7587 domain-containing protein n=1 Tax=Sphaceloma murrayae TaxID=2082308 RepID=A0A2K1QNU1_9PEZI|nr:hypothetical protein CAC42_257 [Sphaceloma murrayae]
MEAAAEAVPGRGRKRASPSRRNSARCNIHWNSAKRLTVAAAYVVCESSNWNGAERWLRVSKLWSSVHPDDPKKGVQACDLRVSLRAQWAERHRKSTWNNIAKTSEDLERQAPGLMRRFRTALADGISMIPSTPKRSLLVTRSSASYSPANSHKGMLTSTYFPPPRDEPSAVPTKREIYAARLRESRATDHGPFDVVPAHEAHPSGINLFYRYYSTDPSHVINAPGTRGFVSGTFKNVNCGVVPPLRHDVDFLFPMIEQHVNRIAIPTPFVSVTNDFFWCLRQAVKAFASGKESMRISMIDGKTAAGIDGSKAYHLRAYSKQLRDRRSFEHGGWRPAGNTEYLVWAHIPKEAIVCDFSILDIITVCKENDYIDRVFRLHYLCVPGPTDDVRAMMQQDHPVIDVDSLTAICDLFGCFYATSLTEKFPRDEYISKLISDITRGWHIRPKRELERKEWLAHADEFARILFQQFNVQTPTPTAQRNIAKGFLWGVLSGFGDLGWENKDDEKLLRKTVSNAKAFGMGDPDDMYAADEDPIRVAIRSYMRADATPSKARIGPGVTKRASPRALRKWGVHRRDQWRQQEQEPESKIANGRENRGARYLHAVAIPRTPIRQAARDDDSSAETKT